jgi:hypothetical protein
MNARKDMNSDVGALYIESLTDVIAIHASRGGLGNSHANSGGYLAHPLGCHSSWYDSR